MSKWPPLVLKKPPLVVRAGDFMQFGEDVRLAMAITDAALAIAEQSGFAPVEVARLRALARGLLP